MKTKKRVLITGGAGFIGSHLALSLITKGYDVVVLDNLSAQVHGKTPSLTSNTYPTIHDKVHFILGDIRKYEDWKKALQNIDIVYHLASETGTAQSMYSIANYNTTNVIGTSLLLDYLVNEDHHIQKVILSSSRAVYGEGKYMTPKGNICYPTSRLEQDMLNGIFDIVDEKKTPLATLPTDENSKLHPISVYGISKLNQEQLISSVCTSIGVNFCILRYQNVYGEGQSLQNPYTGILSIFSNQILQGKNLRIFEDGRPSRDFVHISDVVNSSILAMEKEEAKNTTINVGTGESTSVLDIAQLLITSYQSSVKANVTGEFRLGDIRHNKADMGKMNTLLEYTPKISIKEGIQRFTQWVQTQKIEKTDYIDTLTDLKNKGLLKQYDT